MNAMAAFVSVCVKWLGVLLCLCMECSSKSNVADYYTSQHGLHRLASAEHEIANAVSHYVTILERRLEVAKRFLHDYESGGATSASLEIADRSDPMNLSSKGVTTIHDRNHQASLVTAHPLLTYRLLRRYAKDLPSFEKELRSDEERKFLKLTEKVKAKTQFPTLNDIKGATEGILRVHDTYNINIDEFTSGEFFGLVTNASMNAADCFFIGIYSLQSTILTRAIQWLERAYKLVSEDGDKSITNAEVKGKLEEAIVEHNKALAQRSKNPYLFTEPVKLQESLQFIIRPRKRMLETESHELKSKQPSMSDLTNFASLCTGKQLRNPIDISRLKCWYERKQPLNRLSPLKIERLSEKPMVLQIYDLLPERTLSRILASASETMSRSQVHAKSQPDSKMISSSRTSTSTWLRDGKSSKIQDITKVYRRLEDFTGLKILAPGVSEDLQVSCYGIAGHFNPHLDTIFNSVGKHNLDKQELHRGDRLATIMFYLSNVIRGGATAFSRIGVVAEPVQGSAIFWYNMNEDGEPDPLSLHGGCPILYGNKCVANKWIRFNSQLRQCSTRIK